MRAQEQQRFGILAPHLMTVVSVSLYEELGPADVVLTYVFLKIPRTVNNCEATDCTFNRQSLSIPCLKLEPTNLVDGECPRVEN